MEEPSIQRGTSGFLTQAESSALADERACLKPGQVDFYPNWCVITGAPGSGKSTLANALADQGYIVLEDVARALLVEASARQDAPDRMRDDVVRFQRLVKDRMLLQMGQRIPDQPTFFDYGVAECLAFLKVADAGWPREFIATAVRKQFARIYLLEPLQIAPETLDDSIRLEVGLAIRQRLHGIIEQIYVEIGSNVIRVPAVSVEERVKVLMSWMR
jgi:predicted ATPase